MKVRPAPAVAAAVVDRGKVLMVRRRHPPNADMLALPGGRVEPGETLFEAAVRELCEETGVDAEAQRVLTAIDQIQCDEAGRLLSHFVIVVVECRWTGGRAMAGDDASDARWLDAVQLREDAELCASARQVALELLTVAEFR
ncbi:NUDIX hydrolase [Halomonas sp. MCCC 1A17488]|uniref:NUDIX hydrolase n=1 Tax=unclassified Halomonas TaxID=2609666 RepID=UPI0018D23F93|nr:MULTISPECIES: NUDIX hydrolase [unclassified Halomonas]MCE8015163.1 NUDIX hydrolase [Halomonas sp. MCCC 1A17488]MCG3238496.1 NUDIX hydrolase [Halomonas sp. MCCC 1A17488]QPP47763.1 NUDIX hydrolase [Halomonas sp. SS10-MC5]